MRQTCPLSFIPSVFISLFSSHCYVFFLELCTSYILFNNAVPFAYLRVEWYFVRLNSLQQGISHSVTFNCPQVISNAVVLSPVLDCKPVKIGAIWMSTYVYQILRIRFLVYTYLQDEHLIFPDIKDSGLVQREAIIEGISCMLAIWGFWCLQRRSMCHPPLPFSSPQVMLTLDMYFCPSTQLITAKPLPGRTLTTVLAATPLPSAKPGVTSEFQDCVTH